MTSRYTRDWFKEEQHKQLTERVASKPMPMDNARLSQEELLTKIDGLQAELTEAQSQLAEIRKEKFPVGAICGKCGFRYWEHEGHIIPCPLCKIEQLQSQLAEEQEFKSEHMLKISGLRQTCSDKSRAIIDLQSQLAVMRDALDTMSRGQGKGQTTGPMHDYQYRNLAKEALSHTQLKLEEVCDNCSLGAHGPCHGEDVECLCRVEER